MNFEKPRENPNNNVPVLSKKRKSAKVKPTQEQKNTRRKRTKVLKTFQSVIPRDAKEITKEQSFSKEDTHQSKESKESTELLHQLSDSIDDNDNNIISPKHMPQKSETRGETSEVMIKETVYSKSSKTVNKTKKEKSLLQFSKIYDNDESFSECDDPGDPDYPINLPVKPRVLIVKKKIKRKRKPFNSATKRRRKKIVKPSQLEKTVEEADKSLECTEKEITPKKRRLLIDSYRKPQETGVPIRHSIENVLLSEGLKVEPTTNVTFGEEKNEEDEKLKAELDDIQILIDSINMNPVPVNIPNEDDFNRLDEQISIPELQLQPMTDAELLVYRLDEIIDPTIESLKDESNSLTDWLDELVDYIVILNKDKKINA